jgi:sulfur relay (sulfurtransferase) DsrC/TusE family protein
MNIDCKKDIIHEYDVDDPAIRNIVQEIKGEEGGSSIHNYMNRISELLESIERRKINGLINFLIYGMILNEGVDMETLKTIHEDIQTYLEDYHSTLDDIEDAIQTDKEIAFVLFPELINELRMDKDFYKNHKKSISALLKLLPDIRQNLEHISRALLGM